MCQTQEIFKNLYLGYTAVKRSTVVTFELVWNRIVNKSNQEPLGYEFLWSFLKRQLRRSLCSQGKPAKLTAIFLLKDNEKSYRVCVRVIAVTR